MSRTTGARRLPPHVTVVTDFVAHSQWMAPGIDRYCVAADEVGREFVARGIPRERIEVTGVPVRPAFGVAGDGAEARHALGLADSAPVVLAMSGSWGGLGRLPPSRACCWPAVAPSRACWWPGTTRGSRRRWRPSPRARDCARSGSYTTCRD